MILAKDQFFSWAMMSPRRATWPAAAESRATYRFFQARYAIHHCMTLLGIGPGDRVLAPSYICRAAIDPMLASGAEVGFYAIDRECASSVKDLERCITSQTRAVMIVHYFGFPQPLGEIRRLCEIHGMALIEDCAHVLCGESEGEAIGSIGDAAVFSWRKFLPIYDGGGLVMNKTGPSPRIHWRKETGLFTLKVAANTLEASLCQSRKPLLKLAYRGIRAAETAFRTCANTHLRKSPMMRAEPNDVSFDPQIVNWPMSRISRWTKAHSDINRIVLKRRHNYMVLLQELLPVGGIRPLFPDLPPTVCPWIFPLFFSNRPNAHLALRSRGIPAVTWGGVRHPDIPVNRFTDSDFLYDNLVFLPVHQCLQERDILSVAKAVKELCAN
jgi:dTDP-4-amino-4,6-dideoxygalactose transaminase